MWTKFGALLPFTFPFIFCFALFRGWGRVSDGEEEEGLEGM
jgi:hypothetical protein